MPLQPLRSADREKTVAEIFTANVRSSEGAGTTTLVSTDNRHQVFNLSATRDCVLPTTNIIAGEIFFIVNRGDFDLTVKASGGSALTVANGANMDATIKVGYVTVMALQDAPTTPAHWRVKDVTEEYSVTATFSQALNTGSTSVKVRRTNKRVDVAVAVFSGTAAAASSILMSAVDGVIISRMRPPANTKIATTVLSANRIRDGYALVLQSTGNIALAPSRGVTAGGAFGDDNRFESGTIGLDADISVSYTI